MLKANVHIAGATGPHEPQETRGSPGSPGFQRNRRAIGATGATGVPEAPVFVSPVETVSAGPNEFQGDTDLPGLPEFTEATGYTDIPSNPGNCLQ